MNCLGVGCRSLHVGQHAACSERAVNEWQSIRYSDITTEPFIPYPVLLIQAGAAASGLTLTAAHKIFLMEPFTHHSEELQACMCRTNFYFVCTSLKSNIAAFIFPENFENRWTMPPSRADARGTCQVLLCSCINRISIARSASNRCGV